MHGEGIPSSASWLNGGILKCTFDPIILETYIICSFCIVIWICSVIINHYRVDLWDILAIGERNMVDLNNPLKYHMNDLVYYLNLSTGGNLGKQISYLGAIGAMAKGMLHPFRPERAPDEKTAASYQRLQDEVDEFVEMVDMLDKAYRPMLDTNPYLFQKASRVRKGVQIAEVIAFHIIGENNLIAGNIMRARLVDKFGKDRIKGADGDEF